MSRIIRYTPQPTAERFHLDDSYFKVLMGPVGCGKTAACVMHTMLVSKNQAPDTDGIRRTRWAMIRDTYGNLEATTVKTFKEWIPCHLSSDSPIHGTFRRPLPDGTTIEAEFYFIAINRPEDTEKLRGLELTGAWLNEVSELNEETFIFLRGRVGRFPKNPTWHGVIADTNPPATSHWIYDIFEKRQKVPGFKLFRYPPAVYFDQEEQKWFPNPDAENLRRLDEDGNPIGVIETYYKDQIEGNSEDYIRVMLAGEYGVTRKGKPVFPQYAERNHVASESLLPDRGRPLMIGWDIGNTLNPAACIGQLTFKGGLNILDCIVAPGESLEEFIDDYIMPLINKNYANFKIQNVCDPSGIGRSGYNKTNALITLKQRGLHCVLAPTNIFLRRKEAVDHFLNKIDGFKLDPKITYLRDAFAGKYVYDELKGPYGGIKEQPNKSNPYSHGMDALQYMAIYVRNSSTNKVMKNFSQQKERKFLYA